MSLSNIKEIASHIDTKNEVQVITTESHTTFYKERGVWQKCVSFSDGGYNQYTKLSAFGVIKALLSILIESKDVEFKDTDSTTFVYIG